MGEHKLDRVKSHGWEELSMGPMAEMGKHTPEEYMAVAQLRATGTKMWRKGPCRVLTSQELRPGKGSRTYWHLSISCSDRYPVWDEIKDARYSLLPMGLTFAQILPPMNEFVNIHPNCFHLWELDADE